MRTRIRYCSVGRVPLVKIADRSRRYHARYDRAAEPRTALPGTPAGAQCRDPGPGPAGGRGARGLARPRGADDQRRRRTRRRLGRLDLPPLRGQAAADHRVDGTDAGRARGVRGRAAARGRAVTGRRRDRLRARVAAVVHRQQQPLPELLRARETDALALGARTITEIHRLLLDAALPHAGQIRRADPGTALDTVARAILGACFHNSVRPDSFTDEAAQRRYADELAEMAMAYLLSPGHPG